MVGLFNKCRIGERGFFNTTQLMTKMAEDAQRVSYLKMTNLMKVHFLQKKIFIRVPDFFKMVNLSAESLQQHFSRNLAASFNQSSIIYPEKGLRVRILYRNRKCLIKVSENHGLSSNRN